MRVAASLACLVVLPMLYYTKQQSRSFHSRVPQDGSANVRAPSLSGGVAVTHAAMPSAIHAPARLESAAQRSFWRRVLAVGIDLLVLSLVTVFINSVFGVTQVTSGSAVPTPGSDFTVWTSSTDVGWGWLTLVWQVYCLGLEALFGATVGKWVVRLRVTDREGRRPPLRHLVVRNVVRVVDALPVGYVLGGSVALLSPWRQRLGDQLADTIVLPHEAVAEPWLTPAARRWRLLLAGEVLLICLAVSAMFFYYGRPPLVVHSLVNTQQMMFRDGVSTYTLSAPTWGAGTVTYHIAYTTEHPVDTCHARLTLRWTFPRGWEPSGGEASCASRTP
jgi:uncharacterized RDD family membrane protein YckC